MIQTFASQNRPVKRYQLNGFQYHHFSVLSFPPLQFPNGFNKLPKVCQQPVLFKYISANYVLDAQR